MSAAPVAGRDIAGAAGASGASGAAEDEAGSRRFRTSHGFVTLGVAAAIVGMLAGVIFGTGNADHLVELLPGRAWLSNDERGSLTLVNGATGEPEFEMRFRDAAGDEFEVVQGPEGVFVVNRTTGEITRIDGPTQTIAGSIKVDVADEPLFLIGGGRAYLVLRALGRVQEIDPLSPDLAPIGDPIELGAAIGSAVVDDDGALAAGVVGSGEVAFVVGATVAGRVKVNPAGNPLTVTLVGGDVVAVAQDVAERSVSAQVVQASGVTRTQQVDVPAEGEIAVADEMDGDQLWLLHKGTSTLAGVPLSGGEARILKLEFAAGDDLGAPLPNGSYVYVPNFDQGALLKVDAETGAFVDVIKIGDDTKEFEAFVENGRVWGNDPVGGTAVVIDRDGNVRNVEKYKPGIPTNDNIDGIPVPPMDRQQPEEDRTGPAGGTEDPEDDRSDTGPTGPVQGPIEPPGGLTGPDGAVDPVVPGGPGDPTTTTTTPPANPDERPAPSAGVPGAPGGVSAAGGDTTAVVSWLPALPNGSPVTGYRVTASTGGTQTVDGSTTSASFTGLTNGTPVSFSVHAENAIGVGPAATSNTVTPEKAVPGAPTGVAFALTQPTFEVAVITVTWGLPVEHPDAVAEWTISCTSDSSSTPFEFTAPAAARVMTLDSLPAYQDYFCGIQAVALDGTAGPDVTMTSGTTLQPLEAPPPPTCFTWTELNRINPSLDPMDAYAIQCQLDERTSTLPITGYIWDIHDGVSIIFHQMYDASVTGMTSDRIPYPTGNKLSSMYSYYVDPISGLTVTSAAWTRTA
jgi:hypothetical protein